MTRETPSRRSRAAVEVGQHRPRHDAASRNTDDAIRSAAVSGSISRRCTAATSSASAGVLGDRALDLAARTRGRGGDHLAGEVAHAGAARARRRPRARRGARRCALPQRVDALTTNRLGEDDRRPPRRVRIERDHAADVVLQSPSPRLIHLVDRDHVGDLHDPGLQRLHRVSRARHQDEHAPRRRRSSPRPRSVPPRPSRGRRRPSPQHRGAAGTAASPRPAPPRCPRLPIERMNTPGSRK